MSHAFDPDWVIAPGEMLDEWFSDLGIPRSTAKRYGITAGQLARIFAGDEPIDDVLAQKLCELTGIGAPMWLALEHNYRVGLAAGKTRSV